MKDGSTNTKLNNTNGYIGRWKSDNSIYQIGLSLSNITEYHLI